MKDLQQISFQREAAPPKPSINLTRGDVLQDYNTGPLFTNGPIDSLLGASHPTALLKSTPVVNPKNVCKHTLAPADLHHAMCKCDLSTNGREIASEILIVDCAIANLFFYPKCAYLPIGQGWACVLHQLVHPYSRLIYLLSGTE